MAYTYDAPETLDNTGGNQPKTPGTYHMCVVDVDEEPTGKNNSLLDGFQVTLEILDGTAKDSDGVCTEKGKQLRMMFFNPSLKAKDGGEFARKKIGRLFVATNVMGPDQAGQRGLEIDLQAMRTQQLVMTLELDRDAKFLQLSYADIWHIDDPDAAGFPMDASALSFIPQQFRRDPASFRPQDKPAAQQAKTAGDQDSVSLDDL